MVWEVTALDGPAPIGGMTTNQGRVQRGVPTGGQFSATQNDEPDLAVLDGQGYGSSDEDYALWALGLDSVEDPGLLVEECESLWSEGPERALDAIATNMAYGNGAARLDGMRVVFDGSGMGCAAVASTDRVAGLTMAGAFEESNAWCGGEPEGSVAATVAVARNFDAAYRQQQNRLVALEEAEAFMVSAQFEAGVKALWVDDDPSGRTTRRSSRVREAAVVSRWSAVDMDTAQLDMAYRAMGGSPYDVAAMDRLQAESVRRYGTAAAGRKRDGWVADYFAGSFEEDWDQVKNDGLVQVAYPHRSPRQREAFLEQVREVRRDHPDDAEARCADLVGKLARGEL